jgi:hypothetical protein
MTKDELLKSMAENKTDWTPEEKEAALAGAAALFRERRHGVCTCIHCQQERDNAESARIRKSEENKPTSGSMGNPMDPVQESVCGKCKHWGCGMVSAMVCRNHRAEMFGQRVRASHPSCPEFLGESPKTCGDCAEFPAPELRALLVCIYCRTKQSEVTSATPACRKAQPRAAKSGPVQG